MTKTLVIGYGNPLRGDDGVGWAVVEALDGTLAAAQTAAQKAAQQTAVSTHVGHQLLPELSEPISDADHVIFVDAAVSGSPGQIAETTVTPAPPGPNPFTHHLTPSGLLAMARDVYGRLPLATLITITGHDFSFSEQLSPPVAAAVPQVAARIMQIAGCVQEPS